MTRILKRRQAEQDGLPIARQLRTGHYMQDTIKVTNATGAAADRSRQIRTSKNEVNDAMEPESRAIEI